MKFQSTTIAGLAIAVILTYAADASAVSLNDTIPQTAPLQVAQQMPQQPKRRTLFDVLFGNKETQPPPRQTIQPSVRQPVQPARPSNPQPKKPQAAPKPRTSTVIPATPPKPEAVAKNADARKILVIGDFSASGLAEGLNETFAQSPDLQIINASNGSSGFVRQDYYNWSVELPAILNTQKPAVIVVMIGANDRQTISEKSVTALIDSEEWTKLYQVRIDTLLKVAAKANIPVVWIGQPPYQSAALSQSMLSLNALYKRAASQPLSATADDAVRASFVDIWDGFVDDKGNFTQTGVDVNGQTVRLRGNDGITLTAAGKRKLAFYAEKPLRQILKLNETGKGANSPTAMGTETETVTPQIDKTITRLGPMRLQDLDQSGDDQLVGETTGNSKPVSHSVSPSAPHPGRADDFRWPRP